MTSAQETATLISRTPAATLRSTTIPWFKSWPEITSLSTMNRAIGSPTLPMMATCANHKKLDAQLTKPPEIAAFPPSR